MDQVSATILAATIGGGISFLGLLISKENKVSEFRQAWIDALREEISDLFSRLHALYDMRQIPSEFSLEIWHGSRADFLAANSALASIRLRLNPNEEHAKRVLEVLDEIDAMFSGVIDRDLLQVKCDDLIAASKVLLKSEWNVVKTGEPVFQVARFLAALAVVCGVTFLVFNVLSG